MDTRSLHKVNVYTGRASRFFHQSRAGRSIYWLIKALISLISHAWQLEVHTPFVTYVLISLSFLSPSIFYCIFLSVPPKARRWFSSSWPPVAGCRRHRRLIGLVCVVCGPHVPDVPLSMTAHSRSVLIALSVDNWMPPWPPQPWKIQATNGATTVTNFVVASIMVFSTSG